MSIRKHISPDRKTTTLTIDGRFDFSVEREFRESFTQHEEPNALYRVDLSSASYMDSAALGMLMILKRHADKTSSKVVLCRPSDSVAKVLAIAKFDKLFTTER